MVIQQNSRKLLMMDILMSETCWAHKKWNKITSDIKACNTDTTPTQPHRNSNTHRTKNNTTNMVIQQNRRKLLMMDILMSETCWAHKKWNKIESDIKLVFYSPINTMCLTRGLTAPYGLPSCIMQPEVTSVNCINIYKMVKKVKWSRYRPGVAQRVGRDIALLFHDRGTRRGWVVSSTTRPHFTTGKDPVSILQEAECAPGPVQTGGKSRPNWDSIPDRPARSSVAIPTELPRTNINK